MGSISQCWGAKNYAVQAKLAFKPSFRQHHNKEASWKPSQSLGHVIETHSDPAQQAQTCQNKAAEMAKLGFLSCIAALAATCVGSETMNLIKTAGIVTATAATVSAVVNDLKYRWLQLTTLRHPKPH